MSDSAIDFGTRIFHGEAGIPATTEITFKAITQEPRETPDRINVSRPNQTSRRRRYRHGMSDVDDLVFQIGHDGDAAAIATLLAAAGTRKSWKEQFEDGSFITFEGTHAISPAGFVEGEHVWEVRVAPDTDIVFTP